MLSLSYEDRILSTVSLLELHILAQALHINLHEVHIGIFILILLQINNSFGLCNS